MGLFHKATKSKSKLRLALFGVSGSGKTLTALLLAQGIGGKWAVIDTENGTSEKYAGRNTVGNQKLDKPLEFDAVTLSEPTVDNYIAFITEAGKEGYNLIIDSLSHGWQELLQEVNRIANVKFKGNTWSAWSEGTPKQQKMIRCIQSYPGHIIATIRSKTEWETTKTDNGKSMPVRIGLAPEQGKGIEYEFDMLMEMDISHTATIQKDRTGKYQDKIIECPGIALGRELAQWLDDGIEYVAPEQPNITPDEKPPAQPDGADIGKQQIFEIRDKIKPLYVSLKSEHPDEAQRLINRLTDGVNPGLSTDLCKLQTLLSWLQMDGIYAEIEKLIKTLEDAGIYKGLHRNNSVKNHLQLDEPDIRKQTDIKLLLNYIEALEKIVAEKVK